jgi:hypothetical protein
LNTGRQAIATGTITHRSNWRLPGAVFGAYAAAINVGTALPFGRAPKALRLLQGGGTISKMVLEV